MKNKIETLINYLDELFPNPKCELNYNKDYELLIATMLSHAVFVDTDTVRVCIGPVYDILVLCHVPNRELRIVDNGKFRNFKTLRRQVPAINDTVQHYHFANGIQFHTVCKAVPGRLVNESFVHNRLQILPYSLVC